MSDTPTAYELSAAVTASRLIDTTGATQSALTASYTSAVTGGLYRAADLERGQALLERALLVERVDDWCTPTTNCVLLRELPDDVATELLLQLVLTNNPPLWLYAAIAEDEIRWENVPDKDEAALRQSISDANRREALLISLGQTVDAEARSALGAAGEEHVMAACRSYLIEQGREDLARQVRQVSTLSDQLGYDITSPDTAGNRHRLEVKTTTGIAGADTSINFYISRNEAHVGRDDSQWALVAVRKDVVTEVFNVVGWCRATAFASTLPEDKSAHGKWASARVYLDESRLEPGLPLD